MNIVFTLLINIFLYACVTQAACTTPADRLIAFADGFLISRALYTVAELQIADELIGGPKTAQEIAVSRQLNSEAVYRLLRMLSAHGIFTHNQDNTFALNELSQLLTTSHPQSLHGFCSMKMRRAGGPMGI